MGNFFLWPQDRIRSFKIVEAKRGGVCAIIFVLAYLERIGDIDSAMDVWSKRVPLKINDYFD